MTIVGYSSKICKRQRRFAPTLATFIPEQVATFSPEQVATFTGIRTRAEVKVVLSHLKDTEWLMASLLYGAGLRLMECLRLRVKDIDFSYHQLVVRDGKGQKDRVN